jgi:anti-sigma B factor antagonist
MQDKARPFFAKRRTTDGEIVLESRRECDLATVDELNEALRTIIEQHPDQVLVDLSQATFVDSSTLASLTAAAKQVRTSGGSFRVVGAIAPDVRRVLEIGGLDKYLLASNQK